MPTQDDRGATGRGGKGAVAPPPKQRVNLCICIIHSVVFIVILEKKFAGLIQQHVYLYFLYFLTHLYINPDVGSFFDFQPAGLILAQQVSNLKFLVYVIVFGLRGYGDQIKLVQFFPWKCTFKTFFKPTGTCQKSFINLTFSFQC